MWIEPTKFLPETGDIVGVKLRVGQDLIGDLLPRDSTLINQFVVEDASGRKPVIGRDGASPAGFLRVDAPGLRVVGYRSNASSVEQTAEKFNQYLKEEWPRGKSPRFGPSAMRAARKPGSYSPVVPRACLLTGSPNAAQGDRRLGFTLELVAEKNPYALGAGEELPVRLTYENRPLAGALVVAINRLNPSDKLSARTGADGRVRFNLRSAECG
jgi:hypothetical protein